MAIDWNNPNAHLIVYGKRLEIFPSPKPINSTKYLVDNDEAGRWSLMEI